MPDAELFIHLAEIAGVFVGFGSLLAFRSGNIADSHTIEYLRGMVGSGLWVILTALAPIAISRFGVQGRLLWVPCSLLALIVFVASWIIDAHSPESHAERTLHRAESIRYAALGIPMTLALFGALILILTGAWTLRDQALYFAAVTLGLLETGLDLVWLIWSQAERRATLT